ncbi:DUF3891 family protein [Bacillus horti]|uniref:DUF3891 family protein n=1 Tax=Caldalkalibacillus horti TaxID=77523 RepID=A0ABT9VV16_9BACI|nr:DUF3891 family protein [Bacillus horti]MDQ0164832.1 hypothetical protein [Bacillus horti]
MVVFEGDKDFIMMTQHDHADASAQFAKGLPVEWFETEQHRKDFLFAVQEHDRGWIDLDHTPFWNDEQMAPYSFMDFPMRPKLAFYEKGVNEVEAQNPFAALLCSLHYESFFDLDEEDEAIQNYLALEQGRQERIRGKLEEQGVELGRIPYYFKLIQLCDNASLYICLNEPGVTKNDEFPWYRQGFKQKLETLNHEVIVPEWLSVDTVRLAPFPLAKKIEVQVPYKRVEKHEIGRSGLVKAYEKAEVEVRKVCFTA